MARAENMTKNSCHWAATVGEGGNDVSECKVGRVFEKSRIITQESDVSLFQLSPSLKMSISPSMKGL